MKLNTNSNTVHTRMAAMILLLGAAFLIFFLASTKAEASGFCSQTAEALFTGCKASVNDDSFVKKANCINISDSGERSQCFQDLGQERAEAIQLCADQRDFRLDACKLLGEDRYDPNFDPADFEQDYSHLTRPNPYFPLAIGNKWEYRGGNERNTIEIVNETKLIDGVSCVVARDRVFRDGLLVENTDDWFCQNLDTTVWYFGEEVKDFENFEGDRPRRPELVSNGGSFKQGRDNDKGGIIFLASPKKGNSYLEEFSLANAEDVTTILSASYSFGSNSTLDQFVPQQLVQRFCHGDCVVTKNFSLLEPDVFARKYYARGVGLILEVEVQEQLAVQLVSCNFDQRCAGLPSP
jgi:hypothetical protein